MKVIIAGSRQIMNYQLVSAVISNTLSKYNIQITEIVSGCAGGVDTLGEQWALEHGVKVEPFPALWDDITVPNALIRTNKFGKQYNARAGFQRNEKMAQYGDVLIAVWDGESRGTRDMIKAAKSKNLAVYVYNTSIGG
ncbi:hypothetical protein LCGC14_2495760 [marine sediment metagenome]|uniref:YspA cpYpsA-related SLOG domain-containing protein n=1 Tax=marine sediment metagenome TaxID=412755 RepID=A0A0F9DX53_9ZZZZ